MIGFEVLVEGLIVSQNPDLLLVDFSSGLGLVDTALSRLELACCPPKLAFASVAPGRGGIGGVTKSAGDKLGSGWSAASKTPEKRLDLLSVAAFAASALAFLIRLKGAEALC